MAKTLRDEHIPLSVAAAIAYQQLTAPRRTAFYDGEHLSEVLSRTARALIAMSTVHIRSAGAAKRRRLDGRAVTGAKVRRGATRLVLADGRSYREVSIRRGDLRDTIAALKAVNFTLGG
jgi:hypothetical protein